MREKGLRPQRGLRAGARLGRYSVVRRLGGGGMAELYLARLDGPNRFVKPVALKLMHPHLVDTPEFVAMFMREARIAASLQHPQIVQVLDVGEMDGEYFLALEYVHGLDLRRVLADRRGVPLPLGAALRIVIDIATGLHHAHSLCDATGRPLGIVHRDVSPSNILVAYDGAVKLTDFGIARMHEQTHVTATGSIKGKPGYMSPEQCLQEIVDARSDVFALGVVLYELTTGRPAFPGEMIAAMNRVIDGRYTPPQHAVPGYPPALAAIVAQALAPRVEHRHSSVAVLRAALEAFARTQHGIDTSSDGLARILHAQFGAPAWPDLDTPPPMPVTMTSPTVVTARSMHATTRGGTWQARLRTRSHRVTVGAAGVLAGAVLGWQIARTNAANATEPPAPTAAAIAAKADAAGAPITPPAAPAPPSGPPRLVPVSAPVPTAIAPFVATMPATVPKTTAIAAPVVRARDVSGTPRTKRARTQRAKPRVTETPASPSRSADAMLPRSAR